MGGKITSPLKLFKSDQFASRSNNTNYQAAEDGFVIASGLHDGGVGALYFTIYEGPSNPASTRRMYSYSSALNFTIPVVYFVKKGRWYRIEATGAGSPTLELGWIPCSY